MKIEHLPEYITFVVIVTLGMLLALYTGVSTGSGSSTPFIVISGIVAIAIALVMQAKIWLLIPLFWPMIGKLSGLPGEMPLRDAVIIYVFLVFLALKALKIVKNKPKYTLLDYVFFVNIIYIGLLFVRNPAGFASIESEYVGARPYVDIFSAALAYWVIAHASVSPRLSGVFPILALSGEFLFSFFNFITFHFPSTAPIISRYYTGITPDTYNSPNSNSDTQREQYLLTLGSNQVRLLCSYFSPVSLLNPLFFFRFLGLVLSVYFILRSGHRTGIATCVALFVLGSYFRSGFVSIIRLALIGIPSLVFIVGFQGVLYELPIPAQRALSFLPGNWDHRASDDAEGSTEWRLQMWEAVMFTDKYIKNWWFGDGFGFRRKELQENVFSSGPQDAQEGLLIAGDYHSGPLSSIKFTGYVGTTLFFTLMFGSVALAWKVIQRTKGTPFFSFGLFAGCYLIYFPFKFIFLFGSYKSEAATLIYSIALLNLVDRSVAKWRAEQGDEQEAQSSLGNLVDERPTLLDAAPQR